MNKDRTVINKTMDMEDLKSAEAKRIIAELDNLVCNLRENDLKISSWYGNFEWTQDSNSEERINRGYNYTELSGAVDDKKFPWFLYWEIVWVTLNADFDRRHRVLDLGGSSSLFSYYLASKGIDVTTVDLQETLVDNANSVARQMNWNLKNYVMDMRQLDFDTRFDHITSICVYEHVPMYDRVEINRKIGELLVGGGRFSITFDYRNPSRIAQINSPDDIREQFVEPSGLLVRGNEGFVDTGQDYLLHPFYCPGISWKFKCKSIIGGHFGLREILRTKKVNDYTFGSLFLEKSLV